MTVFPQGSAPPSWHRRLPRVIAAALVCYLATLLVLLALEDRLLYRARRRPGEESLPPPANLPAQDVWLRTDAGCPIHAWWCPYPGAKAAVLFCHGNSGNVNSNGQTVLLLSRALEQSVLVFDYPGFGQSGGKPGEAGCYAAADAAYGWLVKQTPADRITLLGQSLGGGVATDLAARRPHRALVLYKTFTSIPEVAQSNFPLLPARWLVRNQFDSLKKIANCPGPIFVAHGDGDHLIPLAQARRLFEAAPGPKRFLLLAGCGHHGGFTPEFLAALANFLNEVDAGGRAGEGGTTVGAE